MLLFAEAYLWEIEYQNLGSAEYINMAHSVILFYFPAISVVRFRSKQCILSCMVNSVDPDQLASVSTLFSKHVSRVQQVKG